MALVTSLTLFSFLVAAQLNAVNPAAAEADKSGIHLEGTILNSITGEPLPAANVKLQRNTNSNVPGPSYSWPADDKGRFSFDDVVPGTYSLVAQMDGFTGDGPRALLSVAKGQRLDRLDIKLVPQGAIAGRVTDQDGKPMFQIPVVWFQNAYVQGKKQLRRIGSSQVSTNEKGEYRFANLPAGQYFIVAMAYLPNVRTGDPFGADVVQKRNVITFFPNAVEPASAIPVDVTPGVESRGMDIHVRRVEVYSIRGKAMVGPLSAPQMRLELSRTDGMPGPSALTTVRPDGSFEFPYVASGSYVMTPASGTAVLNTPKGAATFSGHLDVRITDRNLDDLTLQLRLTAGGGIHATVRVEGSDIPTILQQQQAQKFSAGDDTASERVYVALREPEENCETSGGRVWPVNDDGTVKTQPVAAKIYSWCMKGLPAGTYVKSARFNDQDVTRKLIDMTTSGGGTLEIVLSTKAAEIEGSVTDGVGGRKSGVRVTFWPKTTDLSNSFGGVYQTTTDQNGNFRATGLAPGSYYAAAWEEILPSGLETYPAFLMQFNDVATAVTLSEGGHASETVKLISSKRIEAEVARLP